MRFLALVAVLAVLAGSTGSAQQTAITETISADAGTGAVGMSESTFAPAGRPAARECLLTLAEAQVRWRSDGVDPTTSVGHVFDHGGELRLRLVIDMRRFRAIATGSSDGILTATCFF